MKKFIICSALFLASLPSFAQISNSPVTAHNREYYLKKHRSQNTSAWMFLLGGVTLMGVGVIIGSSNICFGCPPSTGVEIESVLAIIGAASTVTSIPFFISAAGNKKKAKNLSASLKLEPNTYSIPNGFSRKPFPAFSLQLNF